MRVLTKMLEALFQPLWRCRGVWVQSKAVKLLRGSPVMQAAALQALSFEHELHTC